MHRAGGIISLISGILAIPALIFTMVASAATAAFGEVDAAREGSMARGYLVSGFFVIAIVIVLSIVILNTHTRWPGIVITIACAIAILFTLAGGYVSICLVFALIGALMSLNLGRTTALAT